MEYSQYARVDLATLMSDMTYESEPEIIYSRKGELHKAKIIFRDPERQDMPILPVVRYNYFPYESVGMLSSPSPHFSATA